MEYHAARRFGDLHHRYLLTIGGPRPPKTSTGERVSKSSNIDVDSDAGHNEADRHIKTLNEYNESKAILDAIGKTIEGDLILFCAMPGQTPSSYDNFLKIKRALKLLANMWKISH